MEFVDIHVIRIVGLRNPLMGMWKQLANKWFGLTDAPCESCEILRSMLDESNRERKDLLHRLLEPKQVEPPSTPAEDFQPVTPNFVPWRVRQQMLEQEDRQKAKLMRDRSAEIDKLEKEVGIS
jgi:hypothetical protein